VSHRSYGVYPLKQSRTTSHLREHLNKSKQVIIETTLAGIEGFMIDLIWMVQLEIIDSILIKQMI